MTTLQSDAVPSTSHLEPPSTDYHTQLLLLQLLFDCLRSVNLFSRCLYFHLLSEASFVALPIAQLCGPLFSIFHQ
jgi:hypothetical protein